MKILITGSGGYIGSVLVSFLQDSGHEVVGFDAGYLAHRQFLKSRSGFRLIKGDIRDIEISQLVGFDALCHLAAVSNDPTGELQPEITDDINYRGTVSLAEKAKEAGVKRFIFSGSCSIYGASDTSGYLTEESELNPVTCYGRSKVLAERGLHRLADGKFSPVSFRSATAFGVSPKLRLDLVVNNLAALAYTTGKIAMISDGTPWRPLVHVKDICLAFKCALEAPKSSVHNQIFNIGRTDANYQIRDIAEIVNQVIPEAKITFARHFKEDTEKRTYKVDFQKAEKYLPGFMPQGTLEDGLREICHSYKEFCLKEAHLYTDEFITLNRYKRLLKESRIKHDFRWS